MQMKLGYAVLGRLANQRRGPHFYRTGECCLYTDHSHHHDSAVRRRRLCVLCRKYQELIGSATPQSTVVCLQMPPTRTVVSGTHSIASARRHVTSVAFGA